MGRMSIQSLPYTTGAVCDWIERSWLPQQEWNQHTQAMRQAMRVMGTALTQESPFLFLPGFCCQAAGGDPADAIGVAAAWTLLHRAADILDDWEDGDATSGSTPVLNVATGLIFAAVRSLVDPRRAACSDQARLTIVEDFARVGLYVCGGQHADLVEPPHSLEACWKIVQAKSGACFALACRAGARLAHVADSVTEHYSEFGHHLGMAIQICDDVKGIWSPTGKRSDLAFGRRTLPVSYALSVAPPELQERLLQCLQSASHDTEAEPLARHLIEETGAVVYLAVEARRHWAQAQASLWAADPLAAPRDQLIAWFSEILSLEQQS